DDRWARFTAMRDAIDQATALLRTQRIAGQSAYDFLRRSDAGWQDLVERLPELAQLPAAVARRVEIAAKYEGYIRRQDAQIARFSQLESKRIPADVDYTAIAGLRNEARQKFSQFTPASL